MPCSIGRTCIDRNADEHKLNPSLTPYTCGLCPAGFLDDGSKCAGKDIHRANDHYVWHYNLCTRCFINSITIVLNFINKNVIESRINIKYYDNIILC